MNPKNVQDIYPLAPLQQGILFHCLYSPGSEAYFEQIWWTFEGDLDPAALAGAWRAAAQRHPILRTAFVWEGLDQPLQVVRSTVELPWEEHDWSHLDATAREAELAAFLRRDRARGFELTRAPLLRLALIRLAEGRHRFVWSYHHLLLDGWSAGIVLGEMARLYGALRRGEEPALPPCRPYRDYIAW